MEIYNSFLISGFHEKDGKAFCRKDYFDMFAPKCGGCARAILENYISALNSLWHPECFVCRVSHPFSILLAECAQKPTVTLCSVPAGMLHAVHKRQLFRPRRAAVLRGSLPRATRLAVLGLPKAHHRPLYHSYGQEVPPRALCVCVLPQTAQQGHLQRSERQAVLPRLLRQTLQLGCKRTSLNAE